MTDQGGVTIPWSIVLVVCAAVAGVVVKWLQRGAMADVSKSIDEVKAQLALLRSDIKGELNLLKQTDDTQRYDMNAMDRRLTEVEREWRRYYGGIARALPTSRPQGGHGDPDE